MSRAAGVGSSRSLEATDVRSSNHSRPSMIGDLSASTPRQQIQFRGTEPQTVMVAVDATRELKISAFQWALKNVICPGDRVFLVGIYHNSVNSSHSGPLKVAIHASMFQFLGHKQKPDTSIFNGNSEDQLQKEIYKKEEEFQNSSIVQNIHKQCDEQGVSIDVKIVAGPVMKSVVVKEAEELQANWIILDKHLRKDKKYFMEHLHCNLVLMKPKNVGEVLKLQLDHLKDQEASIETTLDASFTWNLEASRTMESKGFDENVQNSFLDHDQSDTTSLSPFVLTSQMGSSAQFDRYEFSRPEPGISYAYAETDKSRFGNHTAQDEQWEGELPLDSLTLNTSQNVHRSEWGTGPSEGVQEYDYDRNLLRISRNAHLALDSHLGISSGLDSGARLEPSYSVPIVNNISSSRSSSYSDVHHAEFRRASGSHGSNSSLHALSVLHLSPAQSPGSSFRRVSSDHVGSPSSSPDRRTSSVSPRGYAHLESAGFTSVETSHLLRGTLTSSPKTSAMSFKPATPRNIPFEQTSAFLGGIQITDIGNSNHKFAMDRPLHNSPEMNDYLRSADKLRQITNISLTKTPPPAIQKPTIGWARASLGMLDSHSSSQNSEAAIMARIMNPATTSEGSVTFDLRSTEDNLTELDRVQQYRASSGQDDEGSARSLRSPRSKSQTYARPITPSALDSGNRIDYMPEDWGHLHSISTEQDDDSPGNELRRIMNSPRATTPTPSRPKTPIAVNLTKANESFPDNDRVQQYSTANGHDPEGPARILISPRSRTPTPTRPRTPFTLDFSSTNDNLIDIDRVQQYGFSGEQDDDSPGDELRRIMNSGRPTTPTPTRPRTPIAMNLTRTTESKADIDRVQQYSAMNGQETEGSVPRSRTPTPTRLRTPYAVDFSGTNENRTEINRVQHFNVSGGKDDGSPGHELSLIVHSMRAISPTPMRPKTPTGMNLSGNVNRTNENLAERDKLRQHSAPIRQDVETPADELRRTVNSSGIRTPTPTRPKTPVSMGFRRSVDNLTEIDRVQQLYGSSREDDEYPADEFRRNMISPRARTPTSAWPRATDNLNSLEADPEYRTNPVSDLSFELQLYDSHGRPHDVNDNHEVIVEDETWQQFSSPSGQRDDDIGDELRRIMNANTLSTKTPPIAPHVVTSTRAKDGMHHAISSQTTTGFGKETLERLSKYGMNPEHDLQADLSSLPSHGRKKRSTLAPPLCSFCNHKSPEFGRPPRKFTYAELNEATNNFCKENFLAEGGFGFVYKGRLREGQEVAVKQHKLASAQGDNEFCSEVEVLSCAQHRNLVTLIGYCIENQRRLLVYEFVCNRSLDWHLSANNPDVLEWNARQRIAVGAARALRYLHEECRVGCIVHRDMRPNNILLTHDFEPMVGDFGLARWQQSGDMAEETRVIGTLGFLAPEYASSGQITEKADVYSFGVVLLELITGRKAIDASRQRGETCLSDWARPLVEVRMTHELLDPRLNNGDYDIYELNQMVTAAGCCIRKDPDQRPKMSVVLRILEGDTSNAIVGAGALSLSNPVPLDRNLSPHMSYGSTLGSMRRQGSLDSGLHGGSSSGFTTISRRKSDAHNQEFNMRRASILPHSAPLTLGDQSPSSSSSSSEKSPSPYHGNSPSPTNKFVFQSSDGTTRKFDSPPQHSRIPGGGAEGQSLPPASEKSGSPPMSSSKSSSIINGKRIASLFGGGLTSKPKSKLSFPHR